MTKKQMQYQAIEKHGMNIKRIFNLSILPIALSKKLRRLEVKAHRYTTAECNGEAVPEGWEKKIEESLAKVLSQKTFNIVVPVFINKDARGYALKIDDVYVRDNNLTIHTDMGGYGILAPEF